MATWRPVRIQAPLRGVTATAWLLLGALAGCASTAPRIAVFTGQPTSLVWPRPPDPPRIQYLGEMVGEASLGARSRGFGAVRDVLAGPTPPIAFVSPTAVAAAGQLVFVCDPGAAGGAALHVLDLSTRQFRSIRSAGAASLVAPLDVAIHGERVAVADAQRGTVELFSLRGEHRATLGSGQLHRPAALGWSRDGRELWVLDAAAHACVVFDAGGALLRRVGGRGSEPGRFHFPSGLALGGDSLGGGFVAIADAMNFRCQILNLDGTPRCAFGRKGDAAGDFSLPRDAALDSEGHVYVLDSQFENVQIFDARGALLLAFGREGRGAGEFSLPSGLSIDDRDRIWVADTYNRRVQVFQYLRGAKEES